MKNKHDELAKLISFIGLGGAILTFITLVIRFLVAGDYK